MSFEELKHLAKTCFEETFGTKPTSLGIAPGRVNLIGEHTDYNEGFVLPMAIQLYTVVVGAPSDTNICTVKTVGTKITEDDIVEFTLGNITPGTPSWANYVKGVVSNFPMITTPFNAVICTSVPMGAGLSSSAALEVSVFSFLEELCQQDANISCSEKALICQRSEHEFTGMPCGIMDQFVSFHGKENNVLLIDCRSLDYELIPFNDANVAFLVINSNVKHTLVGSEYSSRRLACEQVAAMLAKSSLRDIRMSELETSRNVISQEMYLYARHVITEIARTQSASEALKRKDYVVFGTLMTQSHCSLRDDMKVSCPEMDELVELALECDGVFGTRMTGGGFGGCTITLIKSQYLDSTIEHIKAKYRGNATFYIFKPSDGAKHQKLG